jgi:pimeloyl-ACP methyl ester carboxylesterase/DNA-binding CsgD family transcriptional regulator
MEREVQYCTAKDGVRIAYSIEGEGPTVLWCPTFVESFSLHHMFAAYVELVSILREGRRLVYYDQRGIGLSQRDVQNFTNRALVWDIEAVVSDAGLNGFALWANSMSGPRAITYAAENPEKLNGLVLFGTFAEPTAVMPAESAKALAEFARTNWTAAAHSIAALGFAGGGNLPGRESEAFDEIQQAGRMYERSTDGTVPWSMIVEAYKSWSVRDILKDVKTPTLILHGLNDALFPMECAREMTKGIQGARLVPLSHTGSLATDLTFFSEDAGRSIINKFLGVSEQSTIADRTDAQLTPREMEILSLLVSGQSNRLIAERLVLSERTVARHIANIYEKLGVHGRAAVTAYALRQRLV